MRNKGKYIKLSFLWLALSIMLAHNFIPHHHHFGWEGVHETYSILKKDHHDCDNSQQGLICFEHKSENHQKCNECLFKTDIPDQKFKNGLCPVTHFSNENLIPICLNETEIISFFRNDIYLSEHLKMQSERAPPFFV